jgi:hypothetical protein
MADRFGHGLLVDDGDLALERDPVTNVSRLRTVSGQANLVQALVLRIRTPLGNDEFNTTYGLDVANIFTQPTGARMTKELIKLNLVRTLGTDPRLREVRDVVFLDEPEFLAQHPEHDARQARQRRQERLCRVQVTIIAVDGVEQAFELVVGA